MTELFRRTYAVQVGTLRITDLDVAFSVTRSLKREPNTAELSIFNLNETHRQQIREERVLPVQIEAGYGGNNALIFLGDLRDAHTERDGPDLVTMLSSSDGGRRTRGGRVNRSYGPNTSLRTVILGAAEALGVGLGNVEEAAARADLEGAGRLFSEGVVLSGNAAAELDGIMESSGLEYSIQNGQLQVLDRNQFLRGTAVRLTSDTGLIGSPSEASDGVVTAQCLMIPDVFPGRRVQFDSREVSGFFRVEVASYAGDSAGEDWGIEIECKRQEVAA